MKIAVVGAGISGIASAYYLAKAGHQVHLFEANYYVGGHTDTHQINAGLQNWRIDTGFIVFNHAHYPLFSRFLDELEVESQPSNMSFAVHNVRTGLEYNASSLDALFCQRRNLVKPSFYRMLIDVLRFYREAPKLLEGGVDTLPAQTLADYLRQHRYSQSFIEDHIIPMACALWSGPSLSIDDFPAAYFVQFMQNHKMLTLSERPEWRVVKGGSKSYVEAMLAQFTGEFDGQLYIASPVREVKRTSQGVALRVFGDWLGFDQLVMAVHSDQALAMLSDPSEAEIQVLSGIAYQHNEMHLHRDVSVMPNNRKAWASWNVRVGQELRSACTVSYYMNLLQDLNAPVDFITSLNCGHLIDPDKIYASGSYAHPVYNQQTLASQRRWSEISGVHGVHYCGAYWGWGFHEDGMRSAMRCVRQLNQLEHSGLLTGVSCVS